MNELKPEIKAKLLRKLSQKPVFSKDIPDLTVMNQHQEDMAEVYTYVSSLEPYATEKYLSELLSIKKPFEIDDSQVRGHALTLLLQLPHIDPYALLDEVFLRADKSWRAIACRHVSEQYQKWPSPAAITLLGRVLHYDESVHVRGCAAIALGEIGDAAALPMLQEALNDKEYNDYGLEWVADYAQEAIERILLREH